MTCPYGTFYNGKYCASPYDFTCNLISYNFYERNISVIDSQLVFNGNDMDYYNVQFSLASVKPTNNAYLA